MQQFIVDKIFPAYENHLCGGASGSGKTTLEAQFIEDWRHGRPVFGYRSFPAPFCYIACDRSLQSIHATLRRIGIDYKDWPIISLVDTPKAVNVEQAVLAARAIIPNVEVLWLDGIHSLCPDGKINDYGAVQHFLVAMTRMCQKEGLTFKSLGHATKVKQGEEFLNPRHRFLGSVAWGGYSDTMTIIDQANPEDPADTTRNVYLLPRNAENQVIKYEIVSGRLVPTGDAGEFVMDRWILTYKAGDTITTATIQAFGDKSKVSRATITRWIKANVDKGTLQKCDRGLYSVSFTQ